MRFGRRGQLRIMNLSRRGELQPKKNKFLIRLSGGGELQNNDIELEKGTASNDTVQKSGTLNNDIA